MSGGGRFQGDLPARTFEFAASVALLIELMPSGTLGWTLGKQLLRSGTSIGANVREADHALTDAEFIHRCSVARKEASETEYWLLLCCSAGLLESDAVADVLQESRELMRILSSIVKRSQLHVETSKRGNVQTSKRPNVQRPAPR
jgi:four helix bundle protein